MNFGFTEEQELLRSEARKLLDADAPMDAVRKHVELPEGFSRELWKKISELGWPGLIVPEACGGAGLGFVDLTVLLEETGRSLFPSPLLSTSLAASVILDLAAEDQARRFVEGLADGSRIGTVALLEANDHLAPSGVALRARPAGGDGQGYVLEGEKRFVPDADAADLFVVAARKGETEDDVGFFVVDRGAPGLTTANLPCMDTTKRQGTLRLEGVRVGEGALLESQGAHAFERVLLRGAALATAEMLGAADGALALTVRYAKERIQFGQPIGKFQGVKHPLAEHHVAIESGKSLLYYAAWALDESPEEAPRAVSMAKAYVTDALSRLGLDVVGLHGGIGYTMEYDAQLYLKRSKWAKPFFGDADFHYDRIAKLGGR
ncbi:MAG TPA: acyl-CoA dehydrogenase family protein [Myxococcota bacterium]|jgi:alkylation response protein AidB-like acyl-CoA dehydrogenase|nr:acyl-CoA dehydrogenase family protein [Myxococcota bacterium]